MLIAHITDCHVVERGELVSGRIDTAAALRRAIDHVLTMTPRPDAVIATGDLVNDGLPKQYDHLVELLRPLHDANLPLHVVPGNHDDRDQLRARFPDLPGADAPGGRLDQVIDDHVATHGVRLVGLDTLVPGRHGGRVTADQTAWLDDGLAADPELPTLVFQHHPPFVTGIDWMDENAFDGAELEAASLARHEHVLGVVCGHLHRPIVAPFGRTVASCWPSTGAQLALALAGERYLYSDEPGALALHRFDPRTGLTSHLHQFTDGEPWLPDWAESH